MDKGCVRSPPTPRWAVSWPSVGRKPWPSTGCFVTAYGQFFMRIGTARRRKVLDDQIVHRCDEASRSAQLPTPTDFAVLLVLGRDPSVERELILPPARHPHFRSPFCCRIDQVMVTLLTGRLTATAVRRSNTPCGSSTSKSAGDHGASCRRRPYTDADRIDREGQSLSPLPDWTRHLGLPERHAARNWSTEPLDSHCRAQFLTSASVVFAPGMAELNHPKSALP